MNWLQRLASSGLTADQVVNILMSQPGNAGKDPQRLRERWIESERFMPMEIPIDAVGIASPAVGQSMTQGPIIVDLNKAQVGRFEGQFGAPPDVLVLDGKHRLTEAQGRGEKTIQALVGDKAVPLMERAMSAHQSQQSEVEAAIAEFRANPNGTTLRHLRVLLPEQEVERIRQEVRSQRGQV